MVLVLAVQWQLLLNNSMMIMGIIWPASIAPFEVVIVPINAKDEAQMQIAEKLYADMKNAGIDVLLDDRKDRAGVKFKDADLIGYPVRITVSLNF
mgnify:CR=1 FL=1